MKKSTSLILAFIFILPTISQGVLAFAKENKKQEELTNLQEFSQLAENYDNDYIPDIILDEDDGIKIKGDDFAAPADIILENCAEEVSVPSRSKTANADYAESLGYEVSVNEDSVTLSQPYQTHRLIVKGEDIDELDSLEILPLFDGMYIVQFDDLESTLSALEYYNSREDIEFANPDAVVSVADYNSGDVGAAALDGSTSSTSWGSVAIGFNTTFKLRMGLASLLPEVRVAVVDTGVSYTHKQIKDRITRTYFNSSNSGTTNDEIDGNGHGTHVAGIIAQNTLSNVKIMGYKVLNNSGTGTFAMVLSGLNRAYQDGAQVINLSLAGYNGSPTYDVTHQAYDFLKKHNIVCCVAAGNDGKDCSNLAPAQYNECITVAAMDENDEIPEWSNYGKCVDIIAPGVNISSANYLDDSSYIEKSGTSMATPFVAAAAANVLSKNTDTIPQEVKEFLQINGRDINAPEHFYGAPALYLGNIKKFDMYEKPAAPTFSLSDGVYDEGTKLRINKTSGTDIYYQIYDYHPTKNYNMDTNLIERIEYTEPLVLDHPCIVIAIASYNSFLDSDITQGRYYIQYSSDEGKFTVDDNGKITSYSGNSSNLVIPETINGIKVTAIGQNVFSQRDEKQGVNPDETTNYLRTVTLPDSCRIIENNAFFGCKYLTDVYCNNLETVEYNAFSNASALKNIDLSNVKTIAKGAFGGTAIESLESSSIISIDNGAFSNCKSLEYINLPNLNSLGSNTFYDCNNIYYANLGNVKNLEQYTLLNCSSLETLIVPQLESIDKYAFSYYSGPEYSIDYIYAPKLVAAYGTTIRLSDSGLRFGFDWNETTDFQKTFGEDIEYGFVYEYKNTDNLTVKNGKIKVANNRINHGYNTTFNLVFTDIPKDNYKTEISARAYVCINDFYFYSDITKNSFEKVGVAVINDKDMPNEIKKAVRNQINTEK